MDYIESHVKAKKWKIYCSTFECFNGFYISSKKSLKDGFYMSPYFSKIMAFYISPFFYHSMDYLKMPLNQRLKSFFIFLTS